nr:hypothetical protein B0A51_10514 [Rachicladosporium sp. CCFEE 5018]
MKTWQMVSWSKSLLTDVLIGVDQEGAFAIGSTASKPVAEEKDKGTCLAPDDHASHKLHPTEMTTVLMIQENGSVNGYVKHGSALKTSAPAHYSNTTTTTTTVTTTTGLLSTESLHQPTINTNTNTTTNHSLHSTTSLQHEKPTQPQIQAPSLSPVDNVVSATGRFSPNTPTRRRASSQLARRISRSVHSDMFTEETPTDEDTARWTDSIKGKHISAKRTRPDTDDDRVMIGNKVDENHVNYETAYNMLTGIRFTVSRCNAKIDRELEDSDFTARNKFSFDITGNELTPSAKYDFKFKDYAPWVFRHLRAGFDIDPADYLVSLTSKYVLSELGSPGKSGSFFYFSRDYKYIIKTIHHGEAKFLRKILKDYYNHVRENPNTLLSQFYGLHRVKIPYGRKIHFVVMNNLFPPHLDIHRTFDLKGSTIGRDFKEEDLEKNPRATLKDLNWLRRNLHLEFGPTKKAAFVSQMEKDVALLQRLGIMDYSMLIGVHDLLRGNTEQLRERTLKVYQPHHEQGEDQNIISGLARTPSKLETAKRARELRDMVKRQRPVPMEHAVDKMPAEAHRTSLMFYADNGGYQATHENDMPGEVIYYLGIIDCLTRYNIVKKAEHFWKGFGGNEPQISPIPPVRYGDRFNKFIAGVTMSHERAEKQRKSITIDTVPGMSHHIAVGSPVNDARLSSLNIQYDQSNPKGTQGVMERAERSAERSRGDSMDEKDVPERHLGTVRSPNAEDADPNQVLPVIGEAGEGSSQSSRKGVRLD